MSTRFVIDRHNFYELLADDTRPVIKHPLRHSRTRVLLVKLNHLQQLRDIFVILDFFQCDHA